MYSPRACLQLRTLSEKLRLPTLRVHFTQCQNRKKGSIPTGYQSNEFRVARSKILLEDVSTSMFKPRTYLVKRLAIIFFDWLAWNSLD